MNNNYGKVFLLLLSIGLILLATSGKGLEVWEVLTDKHAPPKKNDGTPKIPNPTELDKGAGSGGAGSGGVKS